MTTDDQTVAFRLKLARRADEERRALGGLTVAAREGAVDQFWSCFQVLAQEGALDRGLRRIVREAFVAPAIQESFEFSWTVWGDSLRGTVRDDLLLVSALRLLMPPYGGPARTLYRGESAEARRTRRYGMAWSSDIATARAFADSARRYCVEGSVLVSAAVPKEAVIFAPAMGENAYGEDEYIVDRRMLGPVRVLQRFPAIDEAK